jgi:hypothetical protein
MDGDQGYMPNSEYVCLVCVYAGKAKNISVLCQKRMVRLEELGEIAQGLMVHPRWYWLSK